MNEEMDDQSTTAQASWAEDAEFFLTAKSWFLTTERAAELSRQES